LKRNCIASEQFEDTKGEIKEGKKTKYPKEKDKQ
jgi:hypothetical protein